MAISERKAKIIELEQKLDARLLSVVTGDRQGMETKIASDILPLISEHLYHIGLTRQLALFLYTPGGDAIAGWGLVNLLRQYCDTLILLVPFRALSCGTLISLGADRILMGRHGLLSPIDPSVGSPFNPMAPGSEQAGHPTLLPLSVEDMIGFLDLARKEIGIKSEEAMVKVMSLLADKVHPLALGAVYRAREHNSTLARRLLSKHLKDEGKITRIVKRLTQELPTHNYLIGRDEAIGEIELDVKEPPTDIEELMWSVYKEYEDWLCFTTPASADLDIGSEDSKRVRYERAVVESLQEGETLFQHIFVTDKELVKVKVPLPGTQVLIDQTADRTLYQGWMAARDGEVLI